MTTYRTENLHGQFERVITDDNQVQMIRLLLDGKLESFRAKRLNHKNAFVAQGKLISVQQSWLMAMRSLDATRWISRLQRQCALAGVCIEVTAIAKRKITIRDHKDIETAVDHQILDALVKAGYLINDDTGNLVIGPMICEPVEKYLLGGRACLLITFRRSGRPCRDSITERVLKFDWPDPEFQMRKSTVTKSK